MPNQAVFLKDYQPAPFSVEALSLNVDLYDEYALVTSQIALVRRHPGPLVLLGDSLELVSIKLNQADLPTQAYHFVDQNLVIDDCPNQATLEIVTKIYPQLNTALSGLYRSNGFFCTQCEAEGFRRITYFLDRPDVLTQYTTRITADKSRFPVLLSNGNLVEKGNLDEGRHYVVWEDPFKKPSYLFALVAGNLAFIEDKFITMSGRVVTLKIFVEPGNEDRCHHAMHALKDAMRWDEKVYGREYDLDIFMIVAVSDFNMGAMENKGLNIFNAKYILASTKTATDLDFAGIESVVAHEYFHNWTGNRVTCRDWFQLSLKEGLTVFRDQEFSRDMNSRDVCRIGDVKVLRNAQFPEDASSMAHPVRPESYEEINNFYTATIYDKGAEVIRMQHALLGPVGFRRGTDLYFDRHDGQAVTIDDFVKAMEEANDKDLTQFKRWYSQAGTPEVTVNTQFDNGTLTLTLTQFCRPTHECAHKLPFVIPLSAAFFDKNGKLLPEFPALIELTQDAQTFQWSGLKEAPIISLNRGFSAPIKLKADESDETLLFLLKHETDGVAKWDAAIKLALSVMKRWRHLPEDAWKIDVAILQGYLQVLNDEALDDALKAELLTPPSFEDVTAIMTLIDVDWVETARAHYRAQLGQYLAPSLLASYEALHAKNADTMSGQAYGERALKNVCLALLVKSDENTHAALGQTQFQSALTMTDELASFTLLAHGKAAASRLQAIATFFKRWEKDDLVLDKWFAIQASADLPTTLTEVKNLLKHPLFSITNPNKARALIGAFCQSNPRQFHQLDGSGYQFLVEMLLQIDTFNPQIASRLAQPFTRWQRYDEKRQALMQDCLKSLKTKKLSKDLSEVVNKSISN